VPATKLLRPCNSLRMRLREGPNYLLVRQYWEEEVASQRAVLIAGWPLTLSNAIQIASMPKAHDR
jgi:hypothetical protein